MLYSKDNRERVKAANPEAKITELFSLLAAEWKAVDGATKAVSGRAEIILSLSKRCVVACAALPADGPGKEGRIRTGNGCLQSKQGLLFLVLF